jgi:cytosine/adenosine deaminase-related metal-dependent hydrolase
MDDAGTVVPHGNVLVRDGRIVAIWQGPIPPSGTTAHNAVEIDLGPQAVIFPGLINLHSHPTYGMLHLWPPPSSHVQVDLGRPIGTEPYANRYQWSLTQAPEYRRLVFNPELLLSSPIGLGLYPEVEKYSEIRAVIGGETALQGALPDPATDNILIRNVDNVNFGRDRIEFRVRAIGDLTETERTTLLTRMQAGEIDAWIVHLAEGVRDGQRRAGDLISSRAEFTALQLKGLLTDATAIVHGNGLEADDFVAMRAAHGIPSETDDGLGAKLIWSPLSNLLLYGETTLVYEALKAGVVVSLGTDWSPSGSRNLLDELKIADIALRDPQLLGSDRDLIPSLSITAKPANQQMEAEIALDGRSGIH